MVTRYRLGLLALMCVLAGCTGDPGTTPAPSTSTTSLPARARSTPDPAAVQRARDIVALVDRYGLHATGPDWTKTRQRALSELGDATTADDTYFPLQRAVRDGGGPHSRFVPAPTAGGAAPAYQPPQVTTTAGITTITLTSDPPTPAAQDRQAQAVTAAIDRSDASTCGWIIDLREHTGGSVIPLFRSLAPLIPDGTLVGFRDRSGAITSDWQITNRTLAARQVTSAPGLPADPATTWLVPPLLRQRPLAVLQSSSTASAAEATVIALRGTGRARTFGEPTRGLTSGNVSLPGPGDSRVVLTTATMTGRDGHDYAEQPITPDQPTTPSQAPKEATAWLQGKGCHLSH